MRDREQIGCLVRKLSRSRRGSARDPDFFGTRGRDHKLSPSALPDCPATVFGPLARAKVADVAHMVHTSDVEGGALDDAPSSQALMSPPPKSSADRPRSVPRMLPSGRAAEAGRAAEDRAAARPLALREGDRRSADEDDVVEEDTPFEDEEARKGLQDRLAAHLDKGRPRVVLTDNLHTMVSIKRGDGVVTFRLHHMFVGAPSPVLRALARYAERRDRTSTRLLRAFIDHNETRIRRRETPTPITCDVEGKYHHLQEIFDELNAQYFAGRIRARITWGPRSRRRRVRDSIKLGSYTFEDELIRIHPVLDAADVPRFFVAWIVYHEMLHEVHDMPVVDGRRVYHTPEFRRAEAQFEHYAESVLWERTYLHKLLER